MANVNAKVQRFESGGTVVITPVDPTGTAMTILNIMGGTLAFDEPVRESLHFADRGTQARPLEGDDQVCDFELDIRCGAVGASELAPVLTGNGPTTGSFIGRKADFTIVVEIPYTRGGSTGVRRTFTNFSVGEKPAFKAGTDFDTMKIKGKYLGYAEATY